MPLLETKGAASAQGFGGAGAGASGPVTYIEDVFSTYLYTGNGSTQTITNGIDLSGKGGLVWFKQRGGTTNNWITDTSIGFGQAISSNLTAAKQNLYNTCIGNTTSTGFTLTAGDSNGPYGVNGSGMSEVSWTFRKQPKFFDVVTYTGNGVDNRQIAHNLGSTPGFIVIKRTDSTSYWNCWHRNYTGAGLYLNDSTVYSGDTPGFSTTQSSTTINLSSGGVCNVNGATYVAYLFAHDAGGFGLSGTDNVISCGSYTGNGLTDGPVINLSYEPQWVMIKRTDSTGNWALIDIMRGFPNTGSAGNYDNGLLANTSGAETTTSLRVKPTSTGFSPVGGDADTNASGGTYIYIAIRRGPMKVPTSGTSVFSPVKYTGDDIANRLISTGFVTDAALFKNVSSGLADFNKIYDRLRGNAVSLKTNSTDEEISELTTTSFASNSGVLLPSNLSSGWNYNGGLGYSYIMEAFRRAPGFFDVVCYTGTGSAQTVNHNLGVAPELMIVKPRSTTGFWRVYSATLGNAQGLSLNATDGAYPAGTYWNTTTPTSTSFSVNATATNTSGTTYVAYLFATCAGVSKVGSYTGTGALQTINCGFTGGARFVLIKRTDSTGDWYVYDSARGISSGNDPYLLLNSTAAEVTGTNYVDTTSVGFQVTAAAPAGLNASGGSYIFLAIA